MWRLFRRTTERDVWWQDADEAATRPTAAVIDRLEAELSPAPAGVDIEAQEEMVDGLRQLLAVVSSPALPVLASQHRVIGTDTCHFIAPVTMAEPAGAAGKLFLTSRRLVLVSSGVSAKPWHAVRRLSRQGRLLTIGAGESAVQVQCNSFGDALVAHHLAAQLSKSAGRP